MIVQVLKNRTGSLIYLTSYSSDHLASEWVRWANLVDTADLLFQFFIQLIEVPLRYRQTMLRISKIIFAGFLILLLVSCATTEKPVERDVDATGNARFDAWRLVSAEELEAINVLLDEVDLLIESHELNAAADKLERVLRIKADYAAAWSRLAWLALAMDAPKRAIQMAKRSNSFAYSDPELQLLNWSFIRSASERLNDTAAVTHAQQKIDSLKTF